MIVSFCATVIRGALQCQVSNRSHPEGYLLTHYHVKEQAGIIDNGPYAFIRSKRARTIDEIQGNSGIGVRI